VASFRRTKKALRVGPDASFTNTLETQDHIIFNPPSSAPNVYHTPLKFLPKTDPRRKLHLLTQASASSTSNSSTTTTTAPSTSTSGARTAPLAPPLRPFQEKKYHLTPADVAEMRRLRAEDPRQWTRVRLAEKFGCSVFFVNLFAQKVPELEAEWEAEHERARSRWGRTKTEAREDRSRRKAEWGRA